MWDKADDACLSALKYLTDWSIASTMIEILDNVAFSNDSIDSDYINFEIVKILYWWYGH